MYGTCSDKSLPYVCRKRYRHILLFHITTQVFWNLHISGTFFLLIYIYIFFLAVGHLSLAVFMFFNSFSAYNSGLAFLFVLQESSPPSLNSANSRNDEKTVPASPPLLSPTLDELTWRGSRPRSTQVHFSLTRLLNDPLYSSQTQYQEEPSGHHRLKANYHPRGPA